MAAGLANFMVNRGITVPDDGNLANLVAEFEASLDAYLSKNIAGGVSVTLNPISEANYPIINLTGALTANINLIVPTATGKWLIANNTTGAFTVTVKTSAGTGVVATQGTANQYYCDGTNVYYAGLSQSFADARYAALLGNTANKFSVAAGVAATDAVNMGQSFGIGQTRQNVTASRVLGTNYVNSTGKAIEVTITAGLTASNGLQINDDSGSGVAQMSGNSATVIFQTISSVIPPGGNYGVNYFVGSTASALKWSELR
jgi:hypothetical protein